MNVEYWNKEKEQWLPSHFVPEDEATWVEWINDTVGWEMYRRAE